MTSCVMFWWSRKSHKNMPNQYDVEEVVTVKREALLYLYTEVRNQNGDSVLQHAAKHAVSGIAAKI